MPRTTGLGSNPKRCLSTSRQRTPGPCNHLGYGSYSQSLFDLERNSKHLLKQLGDHSYFQSTGIEVIGMQCLREGMKIHLCHKPLHQPEEAACCQSDAQRLEGFHLKTQGRCSPGSAQKCFQQTKSRERSPWFWRTRSKSIPLGWPGCGFFFFCCVLGFFVVVGVCLFVFPSARGFISSALQRKYLKHEKERMKKEQSNLFTFCSSH